MTLLELFQKAPREMRAQVQKFATEQERAEGEALAVMMDQYAAALEDATTPREPEPEWFDRWPSWQVYVDGPGWLPIYNTRLDHDEFDGAPIVRFGEDADTGFYAVDEIVQCWPILDTCPAPAGWQVLEAKEGT